VESTFVLGPASTAAVGIIKCFDAQFDFVFVHGAAHNRLRLRAHLIHVIAWLQRWHCTDCQ